MNKLTSYSIPFKLRFEFQGDFPLEYQGFSVLGSVSTLGLQKTLTAFTIHLIEDNVMLSALLKIIVYQGAEKRRV